ncbi:polygalacturonase inhibitor-like [Chenopodium quinoa]|uniref:Leucine-rich repeat-containing N-terminal plant-type domain-containing protein n=1 Tax=Chenopodium quinoa TaxID=63459 RepID=A0A803MA33_CHEQI|nr:polygalacturonase inhibitor-like [Chenopodium quinoa]
MQTSKITLQLYLTFFLYTILTTSSHASKPLCNANDKAALLEFSRYYFGNASHYWGSGDTDCCKDWEGVKCNPSTHRVIELSLSKGELTGHISSAIGNLPYLKTLHIRKQPNIIGNIPMEITNLLNIKYLRLDWNNLSGPIPSYLSQLKKLKFLDLSFNKFSGSIPARLALLPNLYALHLDRNQLSGPIPDSFISFENSNISIYLSHNNLSGPIPYSFGQAYMLDFSRNQLTGDLSFMFKSNNISRINLARNLLDFNMSKLEFGSGFTSINLNHNKIYGSIPPKLAELPHLSFLNVSYNHLCGRIPTGGAFDKFDQSSFIHNHCLCGVPLAPCK